MKISKYIIVVMVILTMAACKKDQYYLYNDSARIQFGPDKARIYTTSFDLADTLKPYTFYYEDQAIKQDTVFFDIYAIGGVAKADRSFTLAQVPVPNVTNAEPGKHYLAFNDPKATKNFVIKAGTVHTSVPIILLRDPSLKTSTPVLKFNVVADDNFKLGELSKIWRKIEFTDRLSQPAAWTASVTQYSLGAYSTVKHQFMITVTGEKWDQTFTLATYSDSALFAYYIAVIKTALVDYNNAHPGNPMRDENGQLVVMP
jgi:hypothetical protein